MHGSTPIGREMEMRRGSGVGPTRQHACLGGYPGGGVSDVLGAGSLKKGIEKEEGEKSSMVLKQGREEKERR